MQKFYPVILFLCSCSHPLGRHTRLALRTQDFRCSPEENRSQQVEERTLGLPHQRHPTTAPMELVAAARSGRTNDVRRLLDAEGCRVDDEGEAGGSPLWYACAGGHYQCAKLLLLRGAAVDRERDERRRSWLRARTGGSTSASC